MTADYRAFLESKIHVSPSCGFEISAAETNPALKPMTQEISRWAVQGGRRAIFASFGLHKTATQLEIMRLIGTRTEGLRLIVMPLGVRQEFRRDAEERFTGEFALSLKFIRTAAEIDDERTIYLTNYESVRDGNLDPNFFTAATLDEAAVLRSYGSKTYQEFLTLFDQVPFRFVATATPSPNRYKELIHYAGFLGIMDTGQALTRFFQRDSTQANNLTLYPHMKREFFTWLHSWAIFVQRPSDLGYSDEGYELPPLRVHYHELPTPAPVGKFDRDGQGALISNAALSLKVAADEKRDSIAPRVAKVLEIVEATDDQPIIWCELNDEQESVERGLVRAGVTYVSLYGSQDIDDREGLLQQWRNRERRAFISKTRMYGAGPNLQQSHTMIFAGVNFKAHDFLQGIHRIHRFGQQYPCDAHVIHTEAERSIVAELQRKWAEDEALRVEMSAIIREHGLSSTGLKRELSRSIGCVRRFEKGDRYEVVNNDAVEEYGSVEGNRFGLIVTSVPFGNHYEYSASYNDFGHNADHEAFFRQMDYLTPELHRTLKPGRIAAIHVKDRIRFGNVTGYGRPSVEPFHADCIAHYRKHGFIYAGMITVVTDVVRENNQTYRLSWTEQCKDGSKMGVGSPEYVLLFFKLPTDTSKGYADERVTKSKADYTLGRWQLDAHSFWRSSGDRLITAAELASYGPDVIGRLYKRFSLETVYDYEQHVRLADALDARGALPRTFMCLQPASHDPDVWDDVTRMRTLNGAQSQKGLTNHICPLQFDIVDRLINRYSSPGEEITDPFGGLFTVPYRALKLGRRGHACELNPAYYDDGLRYVRAAELERAMPSLFDLAGVQGENELPNGDTP